MIINWKKNKSKIFEIFAFLLIIASLTYVNIKKENEKFILTNANELSNKKIEWGIKRASNHEQPDLGVTNKKVIEEQKGLAIGNKEKKYIYLTFDNGYEAGYTEKILKVLKENNVKACFFVTGHYVNSASDLVKQMIDEGHIVGNHTVQHKSMPLLNEEEINEEVMNLHKAVYEKYGYEMKYIRPPKGEYSEKSLITTNLLGYKTVMWSFAYEDWDENKQPEETKAKQKILENVHNGEIMLLHGNSKTNSNILEEIIKEIKNMGYEFKTLDEFE